MSVGVQTRVLIGHILATSLMPEISAESPLRVLIVETDRSIRQLLVLILERQGWRVTTVADGTTAIDLLQKDLPDLLVVDLMLRGTSGFDIIEWIQNTNASWLGHVIILTAASSRVLAELPKARHICRIVRKPFDITELVNSVESCAESLGRLPARRVEALQTHQ